MHQVKLRAIRTVILSQVLTTNHKMPKRWFSEAHLFNVYHKKEAKLRERTKIASKKRVFHMPLAY